MALLSHAMLFIASFLATPTPLGVGHVHVDTCHSVALAAPARDRGGHESAWRPASDEIRVRGYGALRTRDVATVRVLGRCVVKNAPEDAHPVLYVPFGSALDNSDDQDLAEVQAQAKPQFGYQAARGVAPADLRALHASVIQLERPPRV